MNTQAESNQNLEAEKVNKLSCIKSFQSQLGHTKLMSLVDNSTGINLGSM